MYVNLARYTVLALTIRYKISSHRTNCFRRIKPLQNLFNMDKATMISLYVCICVALVQASSFHVYQRVMPDCRTTPTTIYCSSAFPDNVPPGVTEVIVDDFKGDVIDAGMFTDKSWTQVKKLVVYANQNSNVVAKANAFQPLTNLCDLGLHGERVNIENDTFNGVGHLKMLDLSLCWRLSLDSLLYALNGSDKVQTIQVLNISQLNVVVVNESLQLDTEFAEIIGSKNISHINVSQTTIRLLDLVAFTEHLCETLEYVDLSLSHLPNINKFTGTCGSLKRVDLNGAVTAQILPTFFPPNAYYPIDLKSMTLFNLGSHVNTLNINRVWPNGLPKLQNITIVSLTNVHVDIKNMSLSNNGMSYIDITFANVSNSIEFLNISRNKMTYLQPLVLSDNPLLRYLDLSHNDFNMMAENNYTEFESLFKYFKKLVVLDFGSNKLAHLPQQMFKHNTEIERLDLSENEFEQTEFDLSFNTYLSILNLRSNHITRLSDSSMQAITKAITTNETLTVDIRDNALLCNSCACKQFIKWIVTNSDNVLTDGVCIGEEGHKETLDKTAVSKINAICTRTTRIAIATTVSISSTTIFVVAAVLFLRYRQRRSKAAKVIHVLNQIRDGDYRFDFPVFVASSGNDEDFVEHMVIGPLRAHLQDMIGTHRDLISTGDRHFKLGKSIAEETERSCRRCGVVVLVISPSFCASTHCNYEAHIAFTMRKPLILMFKEHVPVEEMPPVLRIIFRLYTRVTWKVQEGQYVMSTTWQNVCESILELMVEQPRLNRQDHLEVINDDE